MVDGGKWQKDEIPPYKHAITPYGTAMAGLPSQIAYGSGQKICQAILLWWRHGHYLTTLKLKIMNIQFIILRL